MKNTDRSISNEHWKASLVKLDVPEITPDEIRENEALDKALRREDEKAAKRCEVATFENND